MLSKSCSKKTRWWRACYTESNVGMGRYLLPSKLAKTQLWFWRSDGIIDLSEILSSQFKIKSVHDCRFTFQWQILKWNLTQRDIILVEARSFIYVTILLSTGNLFIRNVFVMNRVLLISCEEDVFLHRSDYCTGWWQHDGWKNGAIGYTYGQISIKYQRHRKTSVETMS